MLGGDGEEWRRWGGSFQPCCDGEVQAHPCLTAAAWKTAETAPAKHSATHETPSPLLCMLQRAAGGAQETQHTGMLQGLLK